jgi:sulfite exporter TauE/SafE
MLLEYLAITLATALSSFHCAGMCGGFALALAARPGSAWTNAGRQAIYSIGRLTTYLCLGTIAGLAGQVVAGKSEFYWGGVSLYFLAAVLMIGLGLHQLGLQNRFQPHIRWRTPRLLVWLAREASRLGDSAAPYVLGLLNGLLPCGLVFAWLARAASTRSPLEGFLTMVFFGLGTLPMMLFIGLFFKKIINHESFKAARFVSGLALIAFGISFFVKIYYYQILPEGSCPMCH